MKLPKLNSLTIKEIKEKGLQAHSMIEKILSLLPNLKELELPILMSEINLAYIEKLTKIMKNCKQKEVNIIFSLDLKQYENCSD